MKIYFASDHAGFEMKNELLKFVKELGYEAEDCGAHTFDPNDDYPEFIKMAAQAVSEDPENRKAIILGGSGQGEAIVANRFPNVRAVVYYGIRYDSNQWFVFIKNPFQILKLSREHNDANVLSLAARFISKKEAEKAVQIWLETPFSGDERHRKRINQIDI
jgi:ribose 5-phosphate isomerase B